MELTYARTALVVQVTKTGETLFAAGTGNEIALAALREHTLANNAGADRFVASIAAFRNCQQK